MPDPLTLEFLALLAFSLFVGGTPVLIGAMYLVLSGVLTLPLLLILTIITTLLWDSIWYGIGHSVPKEKLNRLPFIRKHAELFEKLEHFYSLHRYPIIFGSRFVYGTNSLISILSGMYIRYPLFIAISLLSICTWFVVLYALSFAIEEQLSARSYIFGTEIVVPLFFVLTLGSALAIKRVLRRLILQRP